MLRRGPPQTPNVRWSCGWRPLSRFVIQFFFLGNKTANFCPWQAGPDWLASLGFVLSIGPKPESVSPPTVLPSSPTSLAIMLRQIRDRLQLDRPLAFALATRCWQAMSGPITIVLLIRRLNLSEQGVYYAIVGIIGIQAYFELGLLNVLVSHSGHEAAAMRKATQESIDRDIAAKPIRIGSCCGTNAGPDPVFVSLVWRRSHSLYVSCALAFGWFTLSDSAVNWQGPLLALVPIAAVSVFLAPALAILEGAGQRDLIYRFRFVQMVHRFAGRLAGAGDGDEALGVGGVVACPVVPGDLHHVRCEGLVLPRVPFDQRSTLQLPMDARCLAHAVASRLDQCDVSLCHPVLHDHRTDVS